MFDGSFVKYKAIVSYQGTFFSGWQSQPSLNTVQDYIESVLYKIFHQKQKIVASSRTDAGVHALGQVFVFYAPEQIEKKRLLSLLNNNFSDSVFIRKIDRVDDSFHPRYHAKKKVYEYKFSFEKLLPFFSPYIFFVKKKIDIDIFSSLLKEFEGEHDFRFFCCLEDKEVSTTRMLYQASIDIVDNIYCVTFVGSGFLRYMVRKIIGFLFWASAHNYSILMLRELLRGNNQKVVIPLASPKGLLLKEVFYFC
jgi:tRNA pseudouridine38-40 synthase